MRAGIAATRLARINAPTATNIKDAGTVGWGTALMLRAKRIHSCRPMAMPTGTPTTAAITAITEACAGNRCGQLPGGESEGLQQGEVAPLSPDRRDQGESQCDDRTDGKARGKDDGCCSGGLVVDDLSRVLDAQDFDTVAGSVRVGCKDLVGETAMRFMSASPSAELTLLRGARRPNPVR